MSGKLLGPGAEAQLKEVVRRVLNEELGSLGLRGMDPREGNVSFVFQTTGTITARSGMTPGGGTAKVFYSTGGTLTAWSTDAGESILNFTTGTIDSWGYAKQDQWGQFWAMPAVSSPSTQGASTATGMLAYLRCDTALYPGDNFASINFTKMEWNGSVWAATTMTVNVRNPGYNACVMPMEQIWATSPNGTNYFPVGEYGLTRWIELSATVTIDSMATGHFINPHDRTRLPLNTSTASTATASAKVYNNHPGWNRKQDVDFMKYCRVRFSKETSKWIIIPPQVSQFATAVITTGETLTPGQTVTAGDFSDWNHRDWRPPTTDTDPAIGEQGPPSNTYNSGGRAGASVWLWRSLDNDVDPWRVVNITRTRIRPIRALRVNTSTGQIQGNRVSSWLMLGSTADNWTNQIATTTCT